MAKIEIRKKDILPLAAFAIVVAMAVGVMMYQFSRDMYGQFCAAGFVQGVFIIAAAIVMLMVANYTRGCLAPIVAIGLAAIVALAGKVVVHALDMEPKAPSQSSLNDRGKAAEFSKSSIVNCKS